MKVEIYHYPNCSTSKTALSFLRSKSLDLKIIDYCKNGVKREEVLKLVKLLKLSKVEELVKKRGVTYRNSGLIGKKFSDDEWVEIIVKNPKILERPIIIINSEKAIIGKNITIIEEFL